MPSIRLLLTLLTATFLITLPFGAWRARTRRYSLPWWLAIHLVIPIIVVMRVWGGVPYVYAPLFIAATVLGQIAGGRMGGGGRVN